MSRRPPAYIPDGAPLPDGKPQTRWHLRAVAVLFLVLVVIVLAVLADRMVTDPAPARRQPPTTFDCTTTTPAPWWCPSETRRP